MLGEIQMSKVLYITEHNQQERKSISSWVGEKFLREYKKSHPDDKIITINLSKENIPSIDNEFIDIFNKLKSGLQPSDLTKAEQNKISKFNKFADQFISADKYVFVNPMFNHFLPNKLKAYLDAISMIGKTIKFNSNGPIGLLKEKKALHIQSSGGIYKHSDIESSDFGHKYLKYIMNFLGTETIDGIFIDGLDVYKDKRDYLKKQASKKAAELAKTF